VKKGDRVAIFLPLIPEIVADGDGAIMISPTPVLPLKPGSASRPLPTIEADVVDKNGTSVGKGKGGFLIIRHPWPAQMRTIFGDPARYETYWTTIEDVYFAGDAATMDSDGYTRIVVVLMR
jgi:acetyl-CoA synthetase